MTDALESAPFMEFDHRDDTSKSNPHNRWREMREKSPVVYSDAYDGFYILSRYEDVTTAARDTEHFSSALNQTQIPTFQSPPHPPDHSDPPQHRLYRQVLNPHFAMPIVETYEPWVQEIVSSVVDPVIASDAFDVPHDIAMPVTRQVIFRMLGINEAPAEVNEWMDDYVLLVGERSKVAGQKIERFLCGEVDKRNRARGQDVLSSILNASENGCPAAEEVIPMSTLVLAGGLETTNSAIAAAVFHLVKNEEDRIRLREDSEIWNSAMEEFVRWSSPVTNMSRTARNDAQVNGCPIPNGARVMLLFGSANRDELEFENPDEVIIDRYPNRHLGFGMGPHRCVGSHLAKLMMRLILQRMLPTLDQWEIEDDSKILWKSAGTRGMLRLPLVRRRSDSTKNGSMERRSTLGDSSTRRDHATN